MNGSRFLERKGNRWIKLTREQARKKVAHALRDSALRQRQTMTSSKPKPGNGKSSERTEPSATKLQCTSRTAEGSDEFQSLPIHPDVGGQGRFQVLLFEGLADWNRCKEIVLDESSFSGTDSDPSEDEYLAEVLQDWQSTEQISPPERTSSKRL